MLFAVGVCSVWRPHVPWEGGDLGLVIGVQWPSDDRFPQYHLALGHLIRVTKRATVSLPSPSLRPPLPPRQPCMPAGVGVLDSGAPGGLHLGFAVPFLPGRLALGGPWQLQCRAWLCAAGTGKEPASHEHPEGVPAPTQAFPGFSIRRSHLLWGSPTCSRWRN